MGYTPGPLSDLGTVWFHLFLAVTDAHTLPGGRPSTLTQVIEIQKLFVTQVCVFPWVFLPNTSDQAKLTPASSFFLPNKFLLSICICKQTRGHIKARSYFCVPPSLSNNPSLLVTWQAIADSLASEPDQACALLTKSSVALEFLSQPENIASHDKPWGRIRLRGQTPIARSSHPPN